MTTGTVKFFNRDKRFGFIKDNEVENQDYFVHQEQLNGIEINEGDVVKFDVVEDEKGAHAENVEMAD